MRIEGLEPEVEQRLREIAVEQGSDLDAGPIDNVINAYLAGARDTDTKVLMRQILAEHREFFDMIGDR